MLDKPARQEMLSIAYLHAIVGKCGVNLWEPRRDIGIDYTLEETVKTEHGHIVPVGHKLDVQLKSTTRATVKDRVVKYDLDLRTYNVLRRTDVATPAILVLFVLPRHESQWVAVSEVRLVLRRCAYWVSLRGAEARRPQGKANNPKVRIDVPRDQRFTPDELNRIMKRVRVGDDLRPHGDRHER